MVENGCAGGEAEDGGTEKVTGGSEHAGPFVDVGGA
jgi:hypothetical protein